jgi:hypothetical protein
MPEWDHKKVAHMVAVWQVIIQHAIRTADLKTCRQTMELLRKYRKAGLATPDAEFSVPNLVFKSLRNDDAIKGIQTIIDRLHDRDLSLGY